MTDALDVAGRLRLHRVLNWYTWYNSIVVLNFYNLVAVSAAGGVPFCD
jgi:hypothetical protein